MKNHLFTCNNLDETKEKQQSDFHTLQLKDSIFLNRKKKKVFSPFIFCSPTKQTLFGFVGLIFVKSNSVFLKQNKGISKTNKKKSVLFSNSF